MRFRRIAPSLHRGKIHNLCVPLQRRLGSQLLFTTQPTPPAYAGLYRKVRGVYSPSRSFYPIGGRRAPFISFRCNVTAPRYCPAHDRPPGGAAQLRYVHLTRARRLRCGVKCAPEPQSYQSDMPPSIASGRHRAVCFPLNGYDVTYHLAASRAAFAAAIFNPRFFRKANAKRQCCLTIFSKSLQAPRSAP